MSGADAVLDSIERVAEQDQDITELLYARFAARCPEHAALMGHMDHYMLGRMMSDVLTLLMTPPDEIDPNYLGFEVSSHRAYGVTPDMFDPLLEVVRDTMKERLGDDWDPVTERAWAQRIASLLRAIATADAAS